MKEKIYTIHKFVCIALFIISFTISFFIPEKTSDPYSYIGPVAMLSFGYEMKNAEKIPKAHNPMRNFFIEIEKPHIYRRIMLVFYLIFLFGFVMFFVQELILLFS